ncbi:MAG: hypothetical protein AABY22_14325 [Nanoarchaeota archaeon]
MEENKKIISIKCSVCGEMKKAGGKRVPKLIEKFGSLEKLNQEYKCMKCRPKPVKAE